MLIILKKAMYSIYPKKTERGSKTKMPAHSKAVTVIP